jgi:hypothetical protein
MNNVPGALLAPDDINIKFTVCYMLRNIFGSVQANNYLKENNNIIELLNKDTFQ